MTTVGSSSDKSIKIVDQSVGNEKADEANQNVATRTSTVSERTNHVNNVHSLTAASSSSITKCVSAPPSSRVAASTIHGVRWKARDMFDVPQENQNESETSASSVQELGKKFETLHETPKGTGLPEGLRQEVSESAPKGTVKALVEAIESGTFGREPSSGVTPGQVRAEAEFKPLFDSGNITPGHVKRLAQKIENQLKGIQDDQVSQSSEEIVPENEEIGPKKEQNQAPASQAQVPQGRGAGKSGQTGLGPINGPPPAMGGRTSPASPSSEADTPPRQSFWRAISANMRAAFGEFGRQARNWFAGLARSIARFFSARQVVEGQEAPKLPPTEV